MLVILFLIILFLNIKSRKLPKINTNISYHCGIQVLNLNVEKGACNIVDKLSFMYQNVRGLKSKTIDFYNNILNSDHDIILITETWLNDSVLNSELSDGRYEVFRRDRGSNGGGVMMLCSRRLNARARTEWQRDHIECLWVTVDGRTIGSEHNLHIALAYMAPDRALPSRINSCRQLVFFFFFL